MTVAIVILGVLLSLYFWSVLGLYVYCKEKSFKKAIADIWYIPIVFIMYPGMMLFSRKASKKSKAIICYLRMPEKLIFFTIAHELYPLAERIAHQKKRESKQCRNIFRRILDVWNEENVFMNGYNLFSLRNMVD